MEQGIKQLKEMEALGAIINYVIEIDEKEDQLVRLRLLLILYAA